MNDDFHNAMIVYGTGILLIVLATVIVLTMLDAGRCFPSLVEHIHSYYFQVNKVSTCNSDVICV